MDFEYRYAGFWMGSDPQAYAYFDTLRAAVQTGLWVAVAPDPRQPERDYSRDMISELSAYLPQTYWTDFQRDALVVLTAARASMAGLDPFEPIMPYNGTPADMEAALGWCFGKGCDAVSLWRMGTANAQQLDAFAQRVPGEDQEEPPDVDDTERKQYQDKIDGLVSTIGLLTGDDLKPLTRKTAAKYVKEYVGVARARADAVGVHHA